MPRKYNYIQKHEKEILKMRSQRMSQCALVAVDFFVVAQYFPVVDVCVGVGQSGVF